VAIANGCSTPGWIQNPDRYNHNTLPLLVHALSVGMPTPDAPRRPANLSNGLVALYNERMKPKRRTLANGLRWYRGPWNDAPSG
jgi:hypothetical protein